MFSNVLLSHSLSLDMLNNFCFHIYAQKWLFIGENCNVFLGHQWVFFDKTVSSTLSCEFRIHRAGSQLKILDVSQKLGTRNTLSLSHFLTLPLSHSPVPCSRGLSISVGFPHHHHRHPHRHHHHRRGLSASKWEITPLYFNKELDFVHYSYNRLCCSQQSQNSAPFIHTFGLHIQSCQGQAGLWTGGRQAPGYPWR